MEEGEISSVLVAHGDLDGMISAVLAMRRHGKTVEETRLLFTQPFLLDKVEFPKGKLYEAIVVDIAVNNRDPEMTWRFIEKISGAVPVVWWYDHHQGWTEFQEKHRLPENVHLCVDAQPSCAQIITSDCSGMVMDAVAADTRQGELSEVGRFIEEATKADLSDDSLRESAVRWVMNGGLNDSDRRKLQEAQERYQRVQRMTEELVGKYEVYDGVAVVDVRDVVGDYDRTQLLLKGEQMAPTRTALLLGKNPEGEEVMTVATMDQKKNLVTLFGLPSGAPFRVSLPASNGWTVERVLKTLSQ